MSKSARPRSKSIASHSAGLAALALSCATPAYAQTGSQVPGGEAQAEASEAEILVTGSRLESTVLTSSVPITSVSAEEIAAAGQENIADVLIDLPSVSVGLSDANSQNQAARVGLSLVNLRRLGSQRTLTLINGRRQVAGVPLTAAVDLNTVPASLVERVEVTTGGSSAIYGADAVSGVINLILKRDFEGIEARVQGGVTSRADGGSYGGSLTAGQNFADGRGNFVVSGLFDSVEGVQATDRRYASNGLNTISNPENTGANDGIPNFITRENIRFKGITRIGTFYIGDDPYVFNQTGTGVRPYDYGEIGNLGGRSIGGDGGFFEPYDNLSLPLDRYVGTAMLNFEFSDALRLFAEARYSRTEAESYWQPTEDEVSYPAPFISRDNPFVPDDLRTLLVAADQEGITLNRVNDEFGRRGSQARRDMQQYTVGADGDFAGSWTYNVFGGYGRTSDKTRLLNGRIQSRFLESLDVVLDPGTNQPVCASAEARAAGCEPLNLFGLGNMTKGAIAYSSFDDDYRSVQELTMAGASVTGELFQLPAGPIEAALGVEWRETTARTYPSELLQTGTTFYPQEAPVRGRTEVSEAFGEIRVPLLEGMGPLAEHLSLQGALRVSDYNTNGTQYSWNAGATYAPVDGLRFRAMRSTSVRAPNIGELFSPSNEGFFFGQDPCDVLVIDQSPDRAAGCAALGIPANYNAPTNGRTIRGLFGGNPDLEPETAETWTVGMVARPAMISGLTLTIDLFDIDITDAIGNIPAQTLINNCVDIGVAAADNPNCAAVTRDPTTFAITSVTATQLNIGALRTKGIDFGVDYRVPLDRVATGVPGTVTFNLLGTYLHRLRSQSDANIPTSEVKLEGVLGAPKWELLGSLTYAVDALTVTWRTQYLGDTRIAWFRDIPDDQFDLPYTGDEMYHDLSLGFEFSENVSGRLNINNIFDNKPPSRGLNIHQGIYDAAIYRNLGTSFQGSLTFRY